MTSKSTTPGHEMTWILFDNADATMMLVKKKNNGPKRKPAARDLHASIDPPPLPSPLPTPSNNQQEGTHHIEAQVTLVPSDPPPPYSPHQSCRCDNEWSKPNVTALPLPPAARIPSLLPPRAPAPSQEPVNSPSAFQLGKSCPDLARLVAKSVQNVKDSMDQEQERKVITNNMRNAKYSTAQEYERKLIPKSNPHTKASVDLECEKESKAEPPRSFVERTKQDHDKRFLAKASQNATDFIRQDRDNKAVSAKVLPSQSGLEELISTKLDNVLTSIDGELFSGDEKELGRVFAV